MIRWNSSARLRLRSWAQTSHDAGISGSSAPTTFHALALPSGSRITRLPWGTTRATSPGAMSRTIALSLATSLLLRRSPSVVYMSTTVKDLCHCVNDPLHQSSNRSVSNCFRPIDNCDLGLEAAPCDAMLEMLMSRITYDETMSSSDALIWHIEQDPQLRSTVMSVWFLERPPSPER